MDINILHENAKGGDQVAEKELFQLLTVRFRYLATLRLGNVADAEEVTQDALLVILGEYRMLVVDTSFAAWAFKVLDNRIRNFARSRQRKSRTIIENSPGDRSSENDDVLKRRLLDCLRKINDANPRYARILNLHYQGYTTDEICEKLEIKPGNFYVILSRARLMLQECMNKGEAD